jgi:hypothetical protein
MVSGASCKFSTVRREKDACDVRVVGGEFANGNEGCDVALLEHAPNEDGALICMVNFVGTTFGMLTRKNNNRN